MSHSNSKMAKQREKAHEEWNRHGHAAQMERKPAAPAERKPLEWKEVKTMRRGKAIAVISDATNVRNETVYSVRFSRLGKDDKPGAYFQFNDLKDLEALTHEVNAYLSSGNVAGSTGKVAENHAGNGVGNGETAQDPPN